MSWNYNYGKKKPRTEYQGPREAAILKSSKDGWLNVSTPYDSRCVQDIKSFIEPSGRAWNPSTKFWEIKEIYLGTIVAILKKHFGEENIIQNITEDANTQLGGGNVFRPLFDMLKTMPNSNMDKIYSALAFAIHPDKGGSNEQMKLLNAAYEEAKK
jgi:hypothetical protein